MDMEYLLILFSFIVHVLTFIILRHYRGLIDRLQVEQAEVVKEKKEIEELLAVYLVEMREENDRLIEQLKEKGINQPNKKANVETDSVRTTATDTTPVSVPEKIKLRKSEGSEKEVGNNTEAESNYQPLSDSVDMNERPTFKKSFQAEVLERYQRGESVATIAKALNRGKTEVELTIKFQK